MSPLWDQNPPARGRELSQPALRLCLLLNYGQGAWASPGACDDQLMAQGCKSTVAPGGACGVSQRVSAGEVGGLLFKARVPLLLCGEPASGSHRGTEKATARAAEGTSCVFTIVPGASVGVLLLQKHFSDARCSGCSHSFLFVNNAAASVLARTFRRYR